MHEHHEFDSPVDLPRGERTRHALGWTTIAIFVASLFLLVTNAFAIRSWIDEQPPSSFQAQMAAWAADWEDATGTLGLGTPRAELHHLWKEGEAARFKGEPQSDQR